MDNYNESAIGFQANHAQNDVFLSRVSEIIMPVARDGLASDQIARPFHALREFIGAMPPGDLIPAYQEIGGDGFTLYSAAEYLPDDLAPKGARYYVAAVFNAWCARFEAAYKCNATYAAEIAERTRSHRQYDRKTFQRAAKTGLFRAFFQTHERPASNRAPNTHTVTVEGMRFALYYRIVRGLSLADSVMRQLVAGAVRFFLGMEVKEPESVEKCANVAPESSNVAPESPDVALKENSFKRRPSQSKNTASGAIRQFIESFKSAIQLTQERHQLNRERQRARLAAEQNGRPRKAPQRDVNAISTPESSTPPGFRGADTPNAPAQPAAPRPVMLSPVEKAQIFDIFQCRADWMPDALAARARTAGVQLVEAVK